MAHVCQGSYRQPVPGLGMHLFNLPPRQVEEACILMNPPIVEKKTLRFLEHPGPSEAVLLTTRLCVPVPFPSEEVFTVHFSLQHLEQECNGERKPSSSFLCGTS